MDASTETTMVASIREFMANAAANGDGDEQDKMTDRELAEDLWLKAGVEVDWTIEQIQSAVRTVRREKRA